MLQVRCYVLCTMYYVLSTMYYVLCTIFSFRNKRMDYYMNNTYTIYLEHNAQNTLKYIKETKVDIDISN